MRTPLAHARGLGSAKDGTEHFWRQRLTAVALVPLVIWFAVSIVAMSGADQTAVAAWLKQPGPAAARLWFIAAGFVHLRLGVQVIIEDYVTGDRSKIGLLMLNTFFCATFVETHVFASVFPYARMTAATRSRRIARYICILGRPSTPLHSPPIKPTAWLPSICELC